MKIKINGKEYNCKKGETILDVAKRNGIYIPTLCYHPDLKIKAVCRVCVVEIKGKKGLTPSCKKQVVDGMEVLTNTPRVKQARKVNLELIYAEHIEKCDRCIWDQNCYLQEMACKYGLKITRFRDRKGRRPNYYFNKAITHDASKCIDCRNCTEVCQLQTGKAGTEDSFLQIDGKGHDIKIKPSAKKELDCIYCGQCIVHCPVGAMQGQGDWKEAERAIKDPKKFVVFQTAPSIRVSLGEEFDMEPGEIVIEKMVGAIKKLGADKVFDVNLGADLTTVVEAGELVERLEKNERLPMFTSCCPGWVKYLEFYHPELVPNLTTARSPHMISGGVAKTYFAKQSKINPRKIFVVSVMPCTAKKFETERKELEIRKGVKPVDAVITTRELAFLIRKNKIDFNKVKPRDFDCPLGESSGAGAIYGASGGVMESALRTAAEKILGKKLPKIDFKQVRGHQGLKEATIKIGKYNLRVAVANEIKNAKEVILKLQKNPKAYHYVEVMACPGGCIGGGGQPVPTNTEIRQKRIDAVYKVDKSKKIRKAHENPTLIKIFEEYFDKHKKIEKKVLETYNYPQNKQKNYSLAQKPGVKKMTKFICKVKK